MKWKLLSSFRGAALIARSEGNEGVKTIKTCHFLPITQGAKDICMFSYLIVVIPLSDNTKKITTFRAGWSCIPDRLDWLLQK